MGKIIFFLLLSLPVVFISWRTLFKVRSHGFYRFLSWECIVWLFVSNYSYWFDNPFILKQIISWIFLFISIYLVVAGTTTLKKEGKAEKARNENSLYQFEKTTVLVDNGIFGLIRHPLYSSLIFLTWGIVLKHITVELLMVSLASTLFLFLTAMYDEKECKLYFGEKYNEYRLKTKMFVPYLI
jgi:protein-S-isoprenylcysteine O-methyltransferase Ste14